MSTRDLAQTAAVAGLTFAGSLAITLSGDSRWHTSTVILGMAFGAFALAAAESYGKDLSRAYAKGLWHK